MINEDASLVLWALSSIEMKLAKREKCENRQNLREFNRKIMETIRGKRNKEKKGDKKE